MLQTAKTKESQNFFFLGSIQSASIGIPCFMIGDFLAQKYTPGIAIGSIIVGNLILWLIGVAIISMGSQNHINGIQNIKNYIGKLGALLSATIFLFCFLDWFALQIHITVENFKEIIPIDYFSRKDFFIRIGTALGLLSAILALGGIRLLKWLAVSTLPLIIIYQIVAMWDSTYSIDPYSIGLSFPAVLTVVLLFLSGMINLPTFFRYSRSKDDSFVGLSFFIVLCTFFECSTIWIQSNEYFILGKAGASIAIALITLTLTCSNLLNIYFASACYETFIPRFSGSKGHAIIGLLGAALYAFVQIASPMEFLVDLFNCYLFSLGVVLLIAFLIRVVVNHRIRPWEKWINCLVWIAGSSAGTITKIQKPEDDMHFLLVGALTISLLFLIILFIEETIWSIHQLTLQKAEKTDG